MVLLKIRTTLLVSSYHQLSSYFVLSKLQNIYVPCALHYVTIKQGSSCNLCIYSLNINFRSTWVKQNNFATKDQSVCPSRSAVVILRDIYFISLEKKSASV